MGFKLPPRPAAAAPVAPKAPAAPAKKAPPAASAAIEAYRSHRKWTAPKLRSLVDNAETVKEMRGRIGSKATGAFTAAELLNYLDKVENDHPSWKEKGQGKGKKGGRPKGSKNKPKEAKAPPAVANPAAALAKAKATLAPKPAAVVAPPALRLPTIKR